MGFFKSIKDMKDMAHEAPEMIDMANGMSANAKAQQAAAEQAAAAAMVQTPGAMPGPVGAGGFDPIAGVSLELYVEISKSFATVGYDQTKGPELAARKGVAAADWDAALAGWNARMQADPAVAKQFNTLYTAG